MVILKNNSLKWSVWNKFLENIYGFIKFWSKKHHVEKAQIDQNATANGIKKNENDRLN